MKYVIVLCLILWPSLARACDVNAGEGPLFTCETSNPSKYISICAVDDGAGERRSRTDEVGVISTSNRGPLGAHTTR